MGEVWSASDRHQFLQVPFTIVSGFVLTWCLRFVYRQTWDKKISIRLTIGFAAFIVAVLLFTLMGTEFNYAIVEGQRSQDPKHFIGWAKYNVFVLGCWSALYLSGKYFLLYQSAERRSEKAEALAQKSRLEMLRYQLHPHFLFNTLNAINTLIVDKQNELATKTLNELSRFLRFSLDAANIHLVTLEQEIKLLEDYVSIEAIRFGDRFVVEYEIEKNTLQCLVPPMLLQPLVENTIKYAVNVVEYPVILKIKTHLEAEFLKIDVIDNGPGPETREQNKFTPKRGGVGHCNIRERLEFYFNGKASCQFEKLSPRGFSAKLYIPLGEAVEPVIGNPGIRKPK